MLISFAFDNIDIYKLESTILDGVGSVGTGRGRTENKTNSAQLELELGLSLQK